MNRELEQYLSEKGWAWKLVEGQRQVLLKEECPFCNKKNHLYFKAKSGVWDCKRCGEKGNLLTMKRRLGDIKIDIRPASEYLFYRGKRDSLPVLPGSRPTPGIDLAYHRALLNGDCPEALEYLIDQRGFTEETIKKFKLGLAKNGTRRAISIPHYYEGELVCIKFRSVPPDKKQYTRWKDCPSVLFNGDCLKGLSQKNPSDRTVFVAEGELDAIALDQLGVERVVSVSTGANKVDWPAHWLQPLEDATEIYLGFDADDAGEQGADKAAAVLGRYRCKRVVPPMKDWGECLSASLGLSEIQNAVANCREYDEQVVRPMTSFGDDLRAMLSQGNPKGRSTGWVTLDSVIGGVREAELTVVTGDTGSGKSTWTTALGRNQVLQGVPCLFAPFEQNPHDLLGKFVGMEASKSIFDLTTTELEDNLTKVSGYPVYILNCQGQTPLGTIKDAIYLAVQRYGVKFVVLDHLHFFLDFGRPELERQAIDAAVRAMAVWVRDLNIHIVLVVHPAKLGRDNKGRVRKVTADDLKGSSEIKKTAWNIIRVWRDRQDVCGSKSDDTEVAVLKCRSQAGSEGSSLMHFDPAGERYLETTISQGQSFGFVAPDDFEQDREDRDWGLPH